MILRCLGLGAALLAIPSVAWAAPCDVTGTVVDERGEPLAGVDVQLEQGTSPRHTTTDGQGAFRFAAVPSASEVSVNLREGGEDTPRFSIVAPADGPRIVDTVDPAANRCALRLGPGDDTALVARVALFRGLRNAFALMERLGIRGEIPLQVEPNDPIASADSAYWVGPRSYNPTDQLPARIVLGTDASSASDNGQPGNREYHEVGHHALATAFGALPYAREHVDGGGYHLNTSSAAAWTEGFAMFFAAMVVREIEQRPDAGRYVVGGASLDLDLDYQPWDLGGLESVAVASLLWDVVDGPTEATASPLTVADLSIVRDDGMPALLIGRVHNPSKEPAHNPRVHVRRGSWSATALVVPAVVESEADAWFALPLPSSEAEREEPLTGLEVQAATIVATDDDDPLSVPLPEVWAALTEFRSEREQSNGRLFDVADLHQALRGRFDAKAIDALFVTHGLFADLNGNRTHDPGEALGLTSHPSHTVEIDGASVVHPAMDPRYRLSLPPALRVTHGVDTPQSTLVVAIPSSAFGGYVVEAQAGEDFMLAAPPAREGSGVSVIAFAPEHRPTILFHRDATTLLAEIEEHSAPYISVTGQLASASATATIADLPPLRWVFIGGAGATALGLLLLGLGWPRRR